MNAYDEMAIKIIREQEQLMGPVAWYEASKVNGLRILDQKKGKISLEGDSARVLDNLVDQFGSVFGLAAREVCKEAVAAIIADLPPSEIPTSLK